MPDYFYSDQTGEDAGGNYSVDNYEVDQQKIDQMGLSYQGRDDNGNRIWTDDQGHQYTAVQLQKQTSDDGGTDSGTSSNSNTGSAANNSSADYVNAHLNQQNVAPPSPPVNQSPVTNTNPVLTYINVVTNPVAVNTWQSVTNTNFNAKPQDNTDGQTDCDKYKSYFYILDKNGNKPDAAAKQFFNLMNDRAGGIFMLCPNGKVFLQQGESPNNVSPSDTTSQILALTINNGINGGKGYNHATTKHTVSFKVLPFDDINRKKTFFDDWDSGEVDVKDYFDLLIEAGKTNPESETPLDKHILQAALIGHCICERFANALYGRVNARYSVYHSKGIKRECEIINEMLGRHYKETKAAYELTDSEGTDTVPSPRLEWFYPDPGNNMPVPPYLHAVLYFQYDASTNKYDNSDIKGCKFVEIK